MVIQGKVGIAMSSRMTALWRVGGATISRVGRADSLASRAVAVSVPAKWHKRGIYLIAAYAPMSGTYAKLVKEREKFWDDVGALLAKAPGGTQVMLGGDMNASVGAKQKDDGGVVGNFSCGARNRTGMKLVEFCQEEGLAVAGSFYEQQERGTWWHIKYNTSHELDHFLVRLSDKRNVRYCKTLHFGGEGAGGRREGRKARRKREKAKRRETAGDG